MLSRMCALAVGLIAAASAQPIIELNDDGGWCWFEDERAIVVNGNTLLFGTIATQGARNGHVEATIVDMASPHQPRRVTLHSPRDEKDLRQWRDDHNSPAFLRIPATGEILALYAKHGPEPHFYYRRSAPGNPLAWGPEQTFAPSPTTRLTYSNLHFLAAENAPTGRIYDFFRGLDNSYKPSYAFSDDLGKTWTAGRVLIDVPTQFRHRPYVKYASNGRDTVHLAYTDGHPRDFANSIYHVFFRAGALHHSTGAPIGPSLKSPAEGTLVYAGGAGNVAWISDVHLDAQGRPYLVFSVHRSNEDHRYHYARFDGAKWHTREIAFAGTRIYAGEDDYTGLATLDPHDPRTVFISTNAHPVSGIRLPHWEIFQGRAPKQDTGKWSWKAITQNSEADNLRPIVPIWNSRQRALLWLRGKMNAYTDYRFQVVGQFTRR